MFQLPRVRLWPPSRWFWPPREAARRAPGLLGSETGIPGPGLRGSRLPGSRALGPARPPGSRAPGLQGWPAGEVCHGAAHRVKNGVRRRYELRHPIFHMSRGMRSDARSPHHMHNGMARSRIARHPIFHMSREIRIIRISPCEVAQLHTTKQTIRIGNTDSQNEVESPPESLHFHSGIWQFPRPDFL